MEDRIKIKIITESLIDLINYFVKNSSLGDKDIPEFATFISVVAFASDNELLLKFLTEINTEGKKGMIKLKEAYNNWLTKKLEKDNDNDLA